LVALKTIDEEQWYVSKEWKGVSGRAVRGILIFLP